MFDQPEGAAIGPVEAPTGSGSLGGGGMQFEGYPAAGYGGGYYAAPGGMPADFGAGTMSVGGGAFVSGDMGGGAPATTSAGDQGLAGGPAAGSDKGSEITQAGVAFVNSADNADIVIHPNGSADIKSATPHGDHGAFNVFREDANMSKETLIAGLKNANDQLADPTKFAQSPFRVNVNDASVTGYDPKTAGKEGDDPDEKDDPKDKEPGGGGGGGGGGACEPPKEDPKEDKEEEEAAKKEEAEKKAEAEKSSNKTVSEKAMETLNQQSKNKGIHDANLQSYAQGLMTSGKMGAFYSKYLGAYDANGDGKLDAEELAKLKAEHGDEYQTALNDVKDKIGNDPAMAEFKASLDKPEGLAKLTSAFASANGRFTPSAADMTNAFGDSSSSVRTAIAQRAINEELSAAGISSSSKIPSDAAEAKKISDKLGPIMDTLVNAVKFEQDGKSSTYNVHKFKF